MHHESSTVSLCSIPAYSPARVYGQYLPGYCLSEKVQALAVALHNDKVFAYPRCPQADETFRQDSWRVAKFPDLQIENEASSPFPLRPLLFALRRLLFALCPLPFALA